MFLLHTEAVTFSVVQDSGSVQLDGEGDYTGEPPQSRGYCHHRCSQETKEVVTMILSDSVVFDMTVMLISLILLDDYPKRFLIQFKKEDCVETRLTEHFRDAQKLFYQRLGTMG